MIEGTVNARLEATIRIAVSSSEAQQQVEATLDTGFSGFLTLPAALITSLKLPWLCRQPGMLADGSLQLFDVYVATVNWDGSLRTVEVEAADCEPLAGMSLLSQYRLEIEVVGDGRVRIERLAER